MAFQSVPGTAEVVIRYIQNGEEMVNVLYAFKPGGYTLSDVTTLATNVDISVAANWLPDQSLDTAYVSTLVRGLEFENDVEALKATSAGPGLIVTAGLPNSVTLSIKKTSGLTGRSARGRLYWIGIPAAKLQTDENRVFAAYVGDVLNAVEAMRVSLATIGWQPVLVSRFSGGVKRAFGITFPWVSVVAVNDIVDTQRRRLPS